MTVSGTTSGPEVLVEIDRGSAEPLHRQLTAGLRDAVRSGRLAPTSRMPSTRVLADDLGVSRRLVVEVYTQLIAEGFLTSAHGAGTFVADIDTNTHAEAADDHHVTRYEVDFGTGLPDLRSFPRDRWLRALRHGLSRLPSESLGYVAPQGLPDTRQAIAGYLQRTRGIAADPGQIVLCSGATQGLGLLAQVLRERGDGTIAMEEPGFWLHRIVLRRNGIDPLPLPVDDHGFDIAALRASPARVALTTPAHQCPTGVVMTAQRRADLLDWARDGNLIIEDDYDAEYRFDRRPIGALQGLAADRVICMGTASKTLAPGLRIGWLVLPPALVDAVTLSKGIADSGNSVMDQVAFAELLDSGDYDRHLRQMRRRYASRRSTLLTMLGEHLPAATVSGAAAGIQLAAVFPDGYDVEELVRRAATSRVHVESTRPFYAHRAGAPPGLLLNYANVTESQIITGMTILGRIARQL
ncbi:MocR-like pyridoxine biosynthesis transcription factor PdxR [Jongsikchunia kroppenstedtii]|uniref:MocR-like pyridoxine biosynthesis transcription factor PdxR n=1 Tax=Jongsikchunia kroppenstedtii TaxID=1121721 RepID=UPI000475F4CE|nr:PLP-dependent aminotransferase family protein [Jongsikchunia kroppenstedtii]